MGRLVGETFFFIFSIFFPERNRVRPVIYENAGILLRVSALLFYFAFLLIKNSSRVFETGLDGLVETQLFFFFYA